MGGTGVLFLVPARYHEQSLRQMKFFDDNTRSWWTPITGGANVPALNDLLAPHNITLGDRILQGHAEVEGRQILVSQPHSVDRQELTGVNGHRLVGQTTLTDMVGLTGTWLPSPKEGYGGFCVALRRSMASWMASCC
jgi:hypothetical protein